MIHNNFLYKNYARDDHSQYGEDGMIEELLKRLNITKGIAVDIGAADGIWYSNTFNLVKKGWTVFEIEGDRTEPLSDLAQKCPNIIYKYAYVSDKEDDNNINKLLKEMDCPDEIDLMSLDIDSIEYWIWDKLKYNPKIMIIEIEPRNYPLDMIYHCRDLSISEREKKDKINPPQNLTGAGPMLELAKKKGYKLIGHTITNLFFLRNDLIDKINFPEITEVNELSNFNPQYLSEENKKKWEDYGN